MFVCLFVFGAFAMFDCFFVAVYLYVTFFFVDCFFVAFVASFGVAFVCL